MIDIREIRESVEKYHPQISVYDTVVELSNIIIELCDEIDMLSREKLNYYSDDKYYMIGDCVNYEGFNYEFIGWAIRSSDGVASTQPTVRGVRPTDRGWRKL